MTKEEYVTTVRVCGKEVKVGIDDYGQSFFIEYEENGKVIEECCGGYNTDYLDYIYARFDKEYHDLLMKNLLDELTEDDKAKLEKYRAMFERMYSAN